MRKTGNIYLSWLSPSFLYAFIIFDPQIEYSLIIISVLEMSKLIL